MRFRFLSFEMETSTHWHIKDLHADFEFTCMPEFICIMCLHAGFGGQKRVLNLLEMELHTAISSLVWVLRTERLCHTSHHCDSLTTHWAVSAFWY